MDKIFHEKQEGCLCAQHCLNALLQEPYFTAVDLATLAQQIDEQERSHMAESGVDRKEYHDFLQQPSGNMDDSGFFSVQVISAALAVWNLELVPYKKSGEAKHAPEEMQAYICNHHEHWFTIRRFGNQWFNLNSLLSGPQLISNTYLSVFLAQLEHDGYSIFVVLGALPPCEADKEILENPIVQSAQPPSVKETTKSIGYRLGSSADDEDLQKAIQLSLGQSSAEDIPSDFTPATDAVVDRSPPEGEGEGVITNYEEEDEVDVDLQIALRLSLELENMKRLGVQSLRWKTTLTRGYYVQRSVEKEDSNGAARAPLVDLAGEEEINEDEELQRALQLSLETQKAEEESDETFRRALQMSLEACPSTSGISRPAPTPRPQEIDQSEVRAARLRYLDRTAASSGKM